MSSHRSIGGVWCGDAVAGTSRTTTPVAGLSATRRQEMNQYSLLNEIRSISPSAATRLEYNKLTTNSAIECLSEDNLKELFPKDTERSRVKALLILSAQTFAGAPVDEEKEENLKRKENYLDNKQDELKRKEEQLEKQVNTFQDLECKQREEDLKRIEEELKRGEEDLKRIEEIQQISGDAAKSLRVSEITAFEVGTSDRNPASQTKVHDWRNRRQPAPSESRYGTESVRGSQLENHETCLMDQIQQISKDAAQTLRGADITTDSEIQDLTREDLRDLFPGVKYLKLRKIISEEIKKSKQAQACLGINYPQNTSDEQLRVIIEERLKTMEEKIMNFLQASLHRHESAAGKPPIVWPFSKLSWPSSATNSDYNKPNKQMKRVAVIKVHCVVSGKTLGSHKTLLQQVEAQGKLQLQESNNPDTCDVIILFCPIVSRMESDIEAAMKQVQGVGNKDIILVVLHHTFNKDYTIPPVSADSRVKYNVHALFHDTKAGLLQCEVNHQAVLQIHSFLLQYSSAGQHQYQQSYS